MTIQQPTHLGPNPSFHHHHTSSPRRPSFTSAAPLCLPAVWHPSPPPPRISMSSLRPPPHLSPRSLRARLAAAGGSDRRFSSLLTPPHCRARTRTILSLLAIAGNTILATFLNGAITVALPSIAKSIHMPQNMLSWPLAMFSLTSGALLLFSGGMADAFGRRNVFLVGNFVFVVLCLAISFVSTSNAFIGCCAGLGLGAALLVPAGVGILGSSIPEGKMKNQSFAMLGAAQPIGFIIGLVLGGLLSTRWQIIFWVLTGLAVSFGVMAFIGLPGDDERLLSPSTSTTDLVGQHHHNHHHQLEGTTPNTLHTSAAASVTGLPTAAAADVAAAAASSANRSLRLRTFDWFGAIMSTGGLILLTFTLADAESAPQGWRTSYVIALIPVSVLLLVGFLLWESHLERLQRTYELGPASHATVQPPLRNATFIKGPPTAPLLPPAIWRAPRFGAVIAVIFLAWAAFNTLSYFSTLVYQEVQKQSAIKTSLLFFPMIGAGLVLSTVSGFVVGRVSALWLIVVGTAMCAASALILSLGVDADTPYYKGMLWVITLQVGPDLFFPAGNLYACKSLGRQHQALAGSLFNTTVRVATSLGLAVSSTIATAVTNKHTRSSSLAPRGLSPSMLLTHHLVPRSGGSTGAADWQSPQSLMTGYKAAGWFCFACSILSMAIAFIYLRDIGIVGDLETKEEDKDLELSELDRDKAEDIEAKPSADKRERKHVDRPDPLRR
ncbi:hypothetical protein ACQY0O_001157 [Thecaphora frezii]